MPESAPSPWRTLTRAAMPAGALCMLAALILYGILDSVTLRSGAFLAPLLAGAALFLGGACLNARWLRQVLTGRRFLIGLNVWAMVLLSLALLLVANAIVAGTPQTDSWAVDVTRRRVHTLSVQTRRILRGLKQDVRITTLLGTGAVSVGRSGRVEVGAQATDLARLYRAQSRRVQVETVDAYLDKTRAAQLTLDAKGPVEPDTILVQCAGRSVQVPFTDLLDLPPAGSFMQVDPRQVGFRGEEKLTTAILRVTEDRQATVYFLAGHGELAAEGAEGKALNRLAGDLRRDNYRAESLNLTQRREVPADCDILLIAGPTAPIPEDEAGLLCGWLEKGGRMFILAQPRAMRGGNLGALARLLSDCNVQVQENEVAIEVYRVGGVSVGGVQIIIGTYGPHPITEDLKTINCLIEHASPVRAMMPEPPPLALGRPRAAASPWSVTSLMQSSDRSWGETDLAAQRIQFDADRDEKGPLSLAVAVERRAPSAAARTPAPAKDSAEGPRLVVVGCTSVASDDALSKYAGNRAFVMNSINWLARKETKLGIPPQRPDRRELSAGPAALKAIFFITVLAMPLLAAAGGAFVWWIRRR